MKNGETMQINYITPSATLNKRCAIEAKRNLQNQSDVIKENQLAPLPNIVLYSAMVLIGFLL